MSRGSAFKLSANMTLGGQHGVPDIQQIRNSLKLLKSKQTPRQTVSHKINTYNYLTSKISSPKTLETIQNNYPYQETIYNNINNHNNSRGYHQYSKGYNGLYSDPKTYNCNIRDNYPQHDPYADPFIDPYADPYADRSHNHNTYSTNHPSSSQQNLRANNKIDPKQKYQNYQPPLTYTKPITGLKNFNTNNNNLDSNPYPPQKIYKSPSYQPNPQYLPRNLPPQRSEQKNLNQLNKQNKLAIIQYSPQQLISCKICSRKFNPNSITKHQKNCTKVFQKKRKQFNAKQQRIIDTQQIKMIKRSSLNQKYQSKNTNIPKWKAQSLAFRAVIKQNRNQQINASQAAMIQQAKEQTGVKCPHCGRKFNDIAGPRHIKFCEQQSKKKIR